MDQNQIALLELLKESLFGQKAELPDDVDWAAGMSCTRPGSGSSWTPGRISTRCSKSSACTEQSSNFSRLLTIKKNQEMSLAA